MAEPRSRRRPVLGEYLRQHLPGILAIIVSLFSLGVAMSANHTQERLLAASVWPSLEFGTGNRSDEGTDDITLQLGNNGVGPARLRGIQVLYQGGFVASSRDLMKRCCGAGDVFFNDVTSGTRGRVLLNGDQIVLVKLPREANSEELWKRFDKARFEITVRGCYCSVLDDCWTFDSAHMDAQAVRSCPVLAVEEEWSG